MEQETHPAGNALSVVDGRQWPKRRQAHPVQSADHHVLVFRLEHAGRQFAEEGQLGQRHVDAEYGVAELAGPLARARKRTDVVEQDRPGSRVGS